MVLDPRDRRRHRTARPRRRVRTAVTALLVTLCCACGGDVKLRLAFALPEGATALVDAATVDLYATRAGTRVAFVSAPYAPGTALTLDGIDKDGAALGLYLTARDAEGATVAYGALGPPATSSIADAGDVCCLTMCVCSVAYQASASCDCGSDGCGACD